MKAIKRSLGNVAMSIVELIIGILLLVDPVGFTTAIIVAFGTALIVYGAVNVIRYFRTEPEEAAIRQLLVKGLVALMAGVFCAFCSWWFVATFPVLTLIYGVVLLITGLTKLQWMVDIIRLKRRRWFLAGISAAFSILCGIVIISSPFSTTTVLWMFTGISLIVEAVFDMIGAIFGDREKKKAKEDTEEVPEAAE